MKKRMGLASLISCIFVIIYLFSSCSFEDQSQPESSEAVSNALEEKISKARTSQLLHYAFDLHYQPLADSLSLYSDNNVRWAGWEDVFFRQDFFRKRLVDFVSADWTEGSWWWQLSIYVDYPENLRQGDPIKFVVHYPWVEFRNDIIIVVKKNSQGQTQATVVSGKYYSRRYSYAIGFFLALLHWIMYAAIVIFVGLLSHNVFMFFVDRLADYLTQGQGSNVWARRFAASLLGAGVLFIIGVAVLFIDFN